MPGLAIIQLAFSVADNASLKQIGYVLFIPAAVTNDVQKNRNFSALTWLE